MARDQAEKIANLLQRGLDAYGVGEASEAIAAWQGVLTLDPENAEALDYLETAEPGSQPRCGNGGAGRAAALGQEIVAEARRLLALGQFEQSLELLRRAAEAGEFCLELEATIELARSNLFRAYRDSVGDLGGVPIVAANQREVAQFNLPPDAGFLLSLIDGETDLESLMTVSGMDAFDALRTTVSLIDVGIVRMRP